MTALVVESFVADHAKLRHDVLRLTPRLKRDYSLMRHPHSVINVTNLLHSSKEADTDQFSGLSEIGKIQMKDSVESVAQIAVDGRLAIRTSSLLRCSMTGNYFKTELEKRGIAVTIEHWDSLIDRNWGLLEGKDVGRWRDLLSVDLGEDLVDGPEITRTAESQLDFYKRMIANLVKCESEHDESPCLLISHCDAIQVLSAVLAGDVPRHYSQNSEFKNAQIYSYSFSA